MNVECHHCGRVTDADLCELCTKSLVKDLHAVPGLVSDMTITRARLDRMTVGRHGGKSAETVLPVRLDQYDRRPTQRPLDVLTNEIGTWARDLAALAGEDLDAALDSRGLRQLVHNHRQKRLDRAALSTETAFDVELAAIWLTHYPAEIRRHPAAAELHDGIADAIAYVRKVIDRQPELVYKGPCTHQMYDEDRQPYTCGTDLYVEKGDEYVSCPHCWTHHSVRELDRRAESSAHDQLMTMPELVRLFAALQNPIKYGTLRSWHSRRQIAPRGWRQADGTVSKFWIRRSDHPVFRVGDVMALHERSKAS